MVCTSKIQAETVAGYGAEKMGRNYQIAENPFTEGTFRAWKVTNLGTGVTYRVNLTEGNTFCTCPFFRENKQFCTCKHIVACREEGAIRQREAEFEADADARAWAEELSAATIAEREEITN